MNQIKMHVIREAVIRHMGLEFKPNTHYHSLPMSLSTHPGFIEVGGIDGTNTAYHVKVLSSAEAKQVSKTKARRPQRVYIWCNACKKWVFAGKFVQHSKIHKG